MPDPLPIAVLVSGSGSNLQALIDHERDARPGYRIAVVVSDRPRVRALDRARAADIPVEVVAWSDHSDRAAFTDAIVEAARRHDACALVLAGFMRILAPAAIGAFPDAIINVHPAILPAFPGADAVPQALEYGATLTGVTVHFVDEQVDHGPIIAQEAVAIRPDDDETSLHTRIRAVEHRLYPTVVGAFARGEFVVDGRRVRHRTPASGRTP
jgi:phosphoribosylglycinamide formyltransferase-1